MQRKQKAVESSKSKRTRTKEQGTAIPWLTAAEVSRSWYLRTGSTEQNPFSPTSFLALCEHTEREMQKDCMEYVS